MVPRFVKSLRLDLISVSALIVLLVVAFNILAQTPCVGVADILDFWRVMRPAGIEHQGQLEAPGYYVRRTFVTAEAELVSAPSSSAFLAWVAKHLTWGLAPGEGRMDLRQMGFFFMAMLVVTLAAGIARGFPVVVALMMTYVIVDPGYLLFFNSFYADGALFVALFGVCIWLERFGITWKGNRDRKLPMWIMSIAVLVFLTVLGSGSKMQYVIFAPVILAAMGVPLAVRFRRFPGRMSVIIVILTLVFVGCWWNFFFGPGPRFLAFNNYHAVYGGILRVASDPNQILEEMKVPEKFRDLPRTDAWSGCIGIDHPVHRYLKNFSRLRLLRNYLSDSAALSAILRRIRAGLSLVESHPRGTRERRAEDSHPVKRTVELPWQYSRVSRWILTGSGAIFWWVICGCVVWIFVGLRIHGWTGMTTTSVFLLVWAGAQAVVAVLGEGLVNLHQHLVGARLGLDLLFVFVLCDIGASFCTKSSCRFRS